MPEQSEGTLSSGRVRYKDLIRPATGEGLLTLNAITLEFGLERRQIINSVSSFPSYRDNRTDPNDLSGALELIGGRITQLADDELGSEVGELTYRYEIKFDGIPQPIEIDEGTFNTLASVAAESEWVYYPGWNQRMLADASFEASLSGDPMTNEEREALSDELAEEAAERAAENIQEQVDEIAEEAPNIIRLAQQCSLVSIMDRLSALNSCMSYSPKVLHLEGKPDFLINLLTKKEGEKDFTDICPELLAEMVPYVRLYKVQRSLTQDDAEEEGSTEKTDRQVEFSFPAATMSSTPGLGGGVPEKGGYTTAHNRGHGVGLKSVDWHFDGSDPYTASRDIKVNLNFFFQDFEDLTRIRYSADPETGESIPYRYVDLILQPNCREAFKNAAPPEESPTTPRSSFYNREFYPECHEIKLVVGWSNPNEGGEKSYLASTEKGRKLLDSGYLEKLKSSLWLTLVDHDFNINQDGTFSLQANYQARISGLTTDPRANVFIGPDNTDIMVEILALKTKIEDLRCNEAELDKQKKKLALVMTNMKTELMSDIVSEMQKRNYLSTISIDRDSYVSLVRSINSGELLTARSFVGMQFEVFKGISNELNSQLEQLQEALERDGTEPLTPTKLQETIQAQGPKILSGLVMSNPGFATAAASAASWADSNGYIDIDKMLSDISGPQTPSDLVEKILTGETYEKLYEDSVEFPFFYLGDLVDIVTRRVLNPDTWKQVGVGGFRGKEYDDAVNDIRIIMGTFSYRFGAGENDQIMNMSDIPISLALFIDWMKANVIDSSKEEYPFIAFLNDIMQNLIPAALGSNCFEGLLGQRLKIRKTFFSSEKTIGDTEPFISSGGRKIASWPHNSEELINEAIDEVVEESGADLSYGNEGANLEVLFGDETGSGLLSDAVTNVKEENFVASRQGNIATMNFFLDQNGNLRSQRRVYDPATVSPFLSQGLANKGCSLPLCNVLSWKMH
jgi:hypothetical protein